MFTFYVMCFPGNVVGFMSVVDTSAFLQPLQGKTDLLPSAGSAASHDLRRQLL